MYNVFKIEIEKGKNMLTTNMEFNIEYGKDRKKILKIQKDKHSIYIGSKYNSNKENEKFLNKINGNKKNNDVFIVYGFGLGGHIQELRKKYENKIIVFEPNINVYQYTSTFEWIKNDENLEIICCEKEKMISIIRRELNEFNFKNSEVLVFSNYDAIYRDECNEFFYEINTYIVELGMDINTKIFFGIKWFENIIRGTEYFVKSIPSDLYNERFKNKPAVIVSAGPSLAKNIDRLKVKTENMLIISGGRTFGPLIEKSIKPDLLVIADATERNYKLVHNYITLSDTPLLFSESANLNIVKEHKGIKIFYSYSTLIDKIVGRKMTHVSTGGSVAHAMASYAGNLGCNPIIFIGQDFAYTGEKAHADIAENKDGSYNYEIAKSKDDIWVKDIYGSKVRTSIVLNNQRLAMEKIIKLYPNTKFINATEGGAKINGTIEMPLKTAIDEYCNNEIEKITALSYPVNMMNNAIIELNKLKDVFKELGNIVDDQILRVERIKETITKTDDIQYYKDIDLQIESNDSKIIGIYNSREELQMLLYESVYDYLRTDNNADVLLKKEEFYIKLKELVEYALNIINKQLITLKQIQK